MRIFSLHVPGIISRAVIVAGIGVGLAGFIVTGGVAYAQTAYAAQATAVSGADPAAMASGGSTVSVILQDITQTIQAIIAEENASSSTSADFAANGEASQLITAVSSVQDILANITQSTATAPFH